MASCGSLVLSHYRGLASIGVVLCLGAVFCVLSTVLLLPSLLDTPIARGRRRPTGGSSRSLMKGIGPVCVVIPAYNAEGTVGAVVRGALAFLPAVIVADDGSTDATRRGSRRTRARW